MHTRLHSTSQRMVTIIPVSLALTQLFLIIKIHPSNGSITMHTSCNNTTTHLVLLLWLLLLVVELTPCLLLLLLLVVPCSCRCCRGRGRSDPLPGQHLHIIQATLKVCLACLL